MVGCGLSGDDDTPFEPGKLHLNLQGQPPPPPLEVYAALVSGSPCDAIVAVAEAEKDRGPNDVGKDLTTYPGKLSDFLAPGEAWCSEFVSWVYRAANHPFTGGSEGGWMLKGSTTIRSWFTQNKTFVSKGSSGWSTFEPDPGDYIRYDTSSGGHSGIVRYAQGTTLYTVEGNVSNKVTFRTISNYKSYSSLDGFGHLDLGCTCSTDTDCDDQDPCTTDTCVSGACTNAPVAGCCTKDAQCDDQDPCTQDTCDANTCKHAQVQGCCTKDAECDDQDPCTTDTCDANKCQHAQVQGCCTTDAQCDDGDADTYDRCVGNKCQSSTVPPDLGPDLGAADLGPGGTTDAGLVIPREAGPDPGLRQSSDEVLMGGCSTTGAGDRAPVGLVAMILVVLLGALTRRRDDA